MIPAPAIEAVERAVADAMIEYGPDDHIDGYKEIARAAIDALLAHMQEGGEEVTEEQARDIARLQSEVRQEWKNLEETLCSCERGHHVIPAEAVEAAAKAIFAQQYDPDEWTSAVIGTRDRCKRDAQAALEAAVPGLMAAAWEEGMQAMYDTTSSEWPPIPERNPYRPTA